MAGGAGTDYLNGDAGRRRLERGPRQRLPLRRRGQRCLSLGRGDGSDYLWDAAGTDRVELGADVTEADVTLANTGSALQLTLATGESLRIDSMFGFDGSTHAGYAVEAIRFADGTEWDLARIKTEALKATSGADTRYAFNTDDSIGGGSGNDILYGRHGNDTLLGGDGNDSLQGQVGNDALDGGTGDDTLSGGEGAVLVAGGSGTDCLNGDAGDDVLNGGLGNDYLYGGEGNDVYRFGRGEGSDRVWDTAGNDSVEFGPDITADQLWFSRSGSALDVSIIGTTDRLTLDGWLRRQRSRPGPSCFGSPRAARH